MAYRIRKTMAAPASVWLTLALVASASAQSVALVPSVGRAEVRTASGAAPDDARRGWTIGALGEASFGALRLRGTYRSGTLAAASGDVPASGRLHQGGAYLGAQLLPGVTLGAGPWVSHVPDQEGGLTILRWRMVADLAVPVIPQRVSGYATIGGSLAGSEIERLPHLGGGGGELGLRWAPPGSHVRAVIGYRLDRESLAFGRVQTLEVAFLALGVALPATEPSGRRP